MHSFTIAFQSVDCVHSRKTSCGLQLRILICDLDLRTKPTDSDSMEQHAMYLRQMSLISKTRMWAMPNVMAALPNIGGDLCSTPQKFGWHPLLECRAVRLPRREPVEELQGCPKLANESQPLVGRSSPYYHNMWRRYCCLTGFFRLSIHALVPKI